MKFEASCLREPKKLYDECKRREKSFEKQGIFDQDVDDIDPNSYDSVDENFEYIKKGFKNFIKHKFYLSILKSVTRDINKNHIHLRVVGKENLKGIKNAIITCNHCSKFDSFAVRGAVGLDIMYVAAEYNNWKGILGQVGRQTGYLPLSKKLNKTLMRKFDEALEYYLLKKKKRVLFYPEQSMWREEARPRPLKNGAFHYAVKYNVPIVPLFITFTPKKELIDEMGRVNPSDFTIHILPPIYPDESKDRRERTSEMLDKNYQAWCDCYEKFYGKKVEYNIDNK